MKVDRAIARETLRVAAGVAVLVALMFGVYAVLGALRPAVIGGGLYTGALAVANFFVMGLTVQSITNRMAEKERTDAEIEEMQIRMKQRMQASYSGRMVAVFARVVLGIAVFRFDGLASILPLIFPRIVILVIQLLQPKNIKGSETH